jgi:hypothetical protein
MWPMVIMLAGSAMQAGGSAFGARQALKQSRYQRDILRYQADYQSALNEINVERVKSGVARTKSAQRAATAASGFQAGDSAELEIDTEMQGEIDVALLRMSGGIENLRLRTAGTMAMAQGQGVAAGLNQRAFGSLLNTGMNYGTREGWFNTTDEKSTSTSLLEKPSYNRSRYYGLLDR